MENRIVRIDPSQSWAICTEVAERLRISLSKDQSATPTSLRKQLDRLREMEEPSPSIVPLMRNDAARTNSVARRCENGHGPLSSQPVDTSAQRFMDFC